MLPLYTVFTYIKRVCPDVRISSAVVSNVVGSMAMTVHIDLELLVKYIASYHESENCRADFTDEFSGVRFHDYSASITYLIFWTGKIIITNGKQSADITAAAYKLYRTFSKCHDVNQNIFHTAADRRLIPLPAGFFRC